MISPTQLLHQRSLEQVSLTDTDDSRDGIRLSVHNSPGGSGGVPRGTMSTPGETPADYQQVPVPFNPPGGSPGGSSGPSTPKPKPKLAPFMKA